MTKKEAAFHILFIAKLVDDKFAGDEDADVWVSQLLWIASSVFPGIINRDQYFKLIAAPPHESRQQKLRNLIEHAATPQHEREAAIAALERMRR